MFDCLLTIICNISPYIKKLTMISSVKLLNLFEAFAAKKFLYSNEKNHHYVFLLLEIFNNLIQYQYEGNVQVVYAILRRYMVFEELSKMPQDLPAPSQSAIVPSASNEKQKEARSGNENLAREGQPANSAANQDANENNNNNNNIASSTPDTASNSTSEAAGSKAAAAHKFNPTNEWIRSWKSRLPIRTIMTLIEKMIPEIEKFCKDSDASSSEEEVLSFLNKTTLVGVLPVPHPILIRKYQTNLQTDLWVTTYIWGLIYLKNLLPPIFDASSIKLFIVHVVD